MRDKEKLGELLESFVNRVSHPRGRALSFMAKASITVPQAILLNFALTMPDSTPSSLASIMKISLPSVSQMVERLVRLGLVQRIENQEDRRRRTVKVTGKAKTFLTRLTAVRSAEYAAGTADLSETTRRLLTGALSQALKELETPIRQPAIDRPALFG